MLQIVEIGQIPQRMTADATSAFILGYEIISHKIRYICVIKLYRLIPTFFK